MCTPQLITSRYSFVFLRRLIKTATRAGIFFEQTVSSQLNVRVWPDGGSRRQPLTIVIGQPDGLEFAPGTRTESAALEPI